jgi:hypothetical protein
MAGKIIPRFVNCRRNTLWNVGFFPFLCFLPYRVFVFFAVQSICVFCRTEFLRFLPYRAAFLAPIDGDWGEGGGSTSDSPTTNGLPYTISLVPEF